MVLNWLELLLIWVQKNTTRAKEKTASFKLFLQRLLRTFRSQQRYLEVSPRLKDEFGTVFEAIQIILEPVLDVKLRQRQNHSVDHGSTDILYSPKKSSFA